MSRHFENRPDSVWESQSGGYTAWLDNASQIQVGCEIKNAQKTTILFVCGRIRVEDGQFDNLTGLEKTEVQFSPKLRKLFHDETDKKSYLYLFSGIVN